MSRLKMPWVVIRVITFIELLIGICLPWKLRCRYSWFLMRLDGYSLKDYNFKMIDDKDREFEKLFHLGYVYLQEKAFDLAIDNLIKALDTDPNHRKIPQVYHLLAKCYKNIGNDDKFKEVMVQLLRISKD